MPENRIVTVTVVDARAWEAVPAGGRRPRPEDLPVLHQYTADYDEVHEKNCALVKRRVPRGWRFLWWSFPADPLTVFVGVLPRLTAESLTE
jgi:hypothetical protein